MNKLEMELRKAKQDKKYTNKNSHRTNHNSNYSEDKKNSYRNLNDRKPRYDRESRNDRKPRYDRESRNDRKPRYDRERKQSFTRQNVAKQTKRDRKMREFYSNGSDKFYNTLKEKLFEILGGKKCSSCGFRDERALGFTHIHDKTAFDEIRRGGFAASWGKYISQPELAKKDILVLCMNCNAIREPPIKKDQKNSKPRSKFFPRKENMNISHEN